MNWLLQVIALMGFAMPEFPAGRRGGRASRGYWRRARIVIKGNKHRRTFHLVRP